MGHAKSQTGQESLRNSDMGVRRPEDERLVEDEDAC